MIELLQKLLELRVALVSLSDRAGDFGVLESLPEIAKMQALERRAFAKVNRWDAPDKNKP